MKQTYLQKSINIVMSQIDSNPELKTQFDAYTEPAKMMVSIIGTGPSSVGAILKMGAALYREWLLSRGIDLKEVAGRNCNG